ncbi:hypothetical protein PCASD_09437 [Puccinia coronata f. sp. avenae]|uniref:Uncharacterized protein n=1 Tax=Puccinia coronata f. sp. avenae TaxID=200324 RepID=A0A2N5UHR0_9BASI|nr:hypothetical protein PCASD_11881 [Puccinia coronata f. sp. avenae]PLW37284.1 hypothetical protein PCASD_09437 [Puccinia coronata f. sp. avenae]
MTRHYSIPFGTPIYCSTFINTEIIALGAGGGTSKSGIKNTITIIKLNDTEEEKKKKTHYQLEKGEDVPMSILFDRSNNQLICGINSPQLTTHPEKNLHLRTFLWDKQNQLIKPKTAQRILTYDSEDNYQRITSLSEKTPKLLAIGGTNNQLNLLNYPSLKPAFSPMWCDQDDKTLELLAVDFHSNGTQFLVASNRNIKLYSTKRTSPPKQNKLPSPDLIRQLEPPTPHANQSCAFRNAMYGRGTNCKTLYTILNYLPNKKKKHTPSIWGPAADPRKAVLMTWNLDNGTPGRSKTISHKPVTCLDMSPSGHLLAFSSSDLSIGILDASSLRSLLSILHAHEFPVTSIKFSPDEKRVVSCSADMTIRVVELHAGIRDRSYKYMLMLISLIMLLVGLLIKFLN